MPPTHEVFNQPPPLTGYDVSDDAVMLDALRREGAGWAEAEVREIGRRAGTAQAQDWGRLANENPPVLRTHDRFGHRIDEVEFHPAWHELMNVAIGAGMHAAPWRDPRPGAHVARAAKFYLWGRAEAGHCCPVSMTYAIVPALRNTPALARAVRAAAGVRRLRPGAAAARRQARPDRRHVDDREAGRLRRARQHHPRGPRTGGSGRRVRAATCSPGTSGSRPRP